MTQKEEVYRYLLEYGSISQMEAYLKLFVCRLSERIRELESDGISIVRTRVSFKKQVRQARHIYTIFARRTR